MLHGFAMAMARGFFKCCPSDPFSIPTFRDSISQVSKLMLPNACKSNSCGHKHYFPICVIAPSFCFYMLRRVRQAFQYFGRPWAVWCTLFSRPRSQGPRSRGQDLCALETNTHAIRNLQLFFYQLWTKKARPATNYV